MRNTSGLIIADYSPKSLFWATAQRSDHLSESEVGLAQKVLHGWEAILSFMTGTQTRQIENSFKTLHNPLWLTITNQWQLTLVTLQFNQGNWRYFNVKWRQPCTHIDLSLQNLDEYAILYGLQHKLCLLTQLLSLFYIEIKTLLFTNHTEVIVDACTFYQQADWAWLYVIIGHGLCHPAFAKNSGFCCSTG